MWCDRVAGNKDDDELAVHRDIHDDKNTLLTV